MPVEAALAGALFCPEIGSVTPVGFVTPASVSADGGCLSIEVVVRR